LQKSCAIKLDLADELSRRAGFVSDVFNQIRSTMDINADIPFTENIMLWESLRIEMQACMAEWEFAAKRLHD
jgi:hypothetical protein